MCVSREGWGRSSTGLVYGGVFVQVGDLVFPSNDWTDFVVVVLSWWCRALSRILAGESMPIEIRFMEGPYSVEISSANRAILLMLKSGANASIQHQIEVTPGPLVDSVVLAAMQVSRKCREQGWCSDDLKELEGAMLFLQDQRSCQEFSV